MAQFDAFQFLGQNKGAVNTITGGDRAKEINLASTVFEYMNKASIAADDVNAALKRQTTLFSKMKILNKNILDNSTRYLKLKEKEKSYENMINVAKKEALQLANKTDSVSKARLAVLNDQVAANEKQLFLTKAQAKIQANSVPYLRHMGKFGETVLKNYESVNNSVIASFSVFKGLFNLFADAVGLMLSPFKKGFEFFNQFQKAAGNIAADIGLTGVESFKLKENFYDSYLSASLLGGTIEDIATAITAYSDAVGKNRVFDDKELSKIIELGLGTKMGVQGASELVGEFSKIGFQLDDIVKSTDKARGVAGKLNLNSTKVLQTYQKLVSSLTGFEFKSGLDNLVKLSAKAESLRFDLTNMQAVSDKLFDPEGAVEAAAKITVLGGKFAQNFGDPFGLMYAAQNAPEMLFDNMMNSVKGIAKKNANGSFFISPSDRKIISEFAQAMGVDSKNLMDTAIEQAKVTDKMGVIASKGIDTFGFSEEDRMAISNLIEMKNGQYTIKLSDGSEKLLSTLTTKAQFDQILKERKKNEDAAIGRKSLMERLSLIGDRFFAGFSKFFDKFLGGNKFDTFLTKVEMVGSQLGKIVGSLLSTDGDLFKSFDKFITSGSSVLDEISKIFSDPTKSFGQKIGEGFSKLVEQMKEPMIDLFGKILRNIMPLLKIPIIETLRLLENIPVIGGAFKNARLNMTKDAVSGDSQASKIMQQMYGKPEEIESGSLPLTSMGMHAATLGGFYGSKALMKGGSKASNLALKGGSKLLGFGAKRLGKLIPGVGAAISGAEGIDNFSKGNYGRSALNFLSAGASFVPGVGTGIAFGADAISTGIDVGEMYGDYRNQTLGNIDRGAETVQDLVISKHGAFKTDKGDLLMAIHEDGFKKQQGSSNSGGGVMEINHTGTITLKSENGTSITVDDLNRFKYSIIPTILNQMESQKNGHITHNTRSFPVEPI